jgi:hypothetical protein
MPRKTRLATRGTIHHNDGPGGCLFRSFGDRKDFLNPVEVLREGDLLSVHDWALLGKNATSPFKWSTKDLP